MMKIVHTVQTVHIFNEQNGRIDTINCVLNEKTVFLSSLDTELADRDAHQTPTHIQFHYPGFILTRTQNRMYKPV